MSKIGFKLLQTSKNSNERQIYVIHRHKNSDFQRSVGLSIVPAYFDLKTGRASNVPNAPEINRVIQSLVSDLETAARNCEGKGLEPTKPVIQAAYEELVAKAPLKASFKAQEARIAGSVLECLYEELRGLEAAVIAKKAAIETEELKQGVFRNMLLAVYVDKYIQARKETLAANSIRLFPNLKEWVMRFNATWRIDDVNKSTLTRFQNFLIKQDKKSGSIADLVTKLKSVVLYYEDELQLDLKSFRSFKLGFKKKRNDNVIYLTKSELQALLDLELSKPTDTITRDVFCLMSLTGLRWVDSYVRPEQIEQGRIRIITEKTDTDLLIPIGSQAQELLSRLFSREDYKPLVSQHFNERIKNICALVPEIAEKKELVKTYKGKNKADSKIYKPKASLITCHTGRRTFINLALAKGISPATIASIVGHEGTELIMKTYSNKSVGIERIVELMN
jgi:integrase